MSNILILFSIIVLMNPKGFYSFAIQRDKIQGTIAFFTGILLVFFKLPLPGIVCEVVGAYWLFGGFYPMLLTLLMKIPYISNFIPFLGGNDESLPL